MWQKLGNRPLRFGTFPRPKSSVIYGILVPTSNGHFGRLAKFAEKLHHISRMQAGVEETLCFHAVLEPQFGCTHTHTLAPQRTRQRLFNGTLEAHAVAPLKKHTPSPTSRDW